MLDRKLLNQDSGGISLLVIALGLSFITLLICLVNVERVVLQKHRLNLRADSIALAAASRFFDSPSKVCEEAFVFATQYGVELESCETTNFTVKISISQATQSPALVSWLPLVKSSAKAGLS